MKIRVYRGYLRRLVSCPICGMQSCSRRRSCYAKASQCDGSGRNSGATEFIGFDIGHLQNLWRQKLQGQGRLIAAKLRCQRHQRGSDFDFINATRCAQALRGFPLKRHACRFGPSLKHLLKISITICPEAARHACTCDVNQFRQGFWLCVCFANFSARQIRFWAC